MTDIYARRSKENSPYGSPAHKKGQNQQSYSPCTKDESSPKLKKAQFITESPFKGKLLQPLRELETGVNTNQTTRTTMNYSTFADPRAQQFAHRKNIYTTGTYLPNVGVNQYTTLSNLQNDYNCNSQRQQSQQINLNVLVVSKEEIEFPWRQECEYLQNIILELEQHRKVEVVREVVKEYVQVENTQRISVFEEEQRRLKDQIVRLQSENGRFLDENGRQLNQIIVLKEQLSTRTKELEIRSRELDTRTLELEAKTRELEKLKQRGMSSDSQSMNLNADIAQLRQLLQERDGTISRLQTKNNEFELRIQQLNQEIDQLNSQSRSRMEEIVGLKRQIDNLQSSLTDAGRFKEYENQVIQLKNELDRLGNLLKSRTSEYEILRFQYMESESQTSRRANEFQMKIRDMENNNMMLQSEIDRLMGMLRAKDSEIDRLRSSYEELESQGVNVVQERVTFLSNEVDIWKNRFIKVNHDYNASQELLIMADAELESIKKNKKEVTVTRSVRMRNSQTRKSGLETLDNSNYVTTSQEKSFTQLPQEKSFIKITGTSLPQIPSSSTYTTNQQSSIPQGQSFTTTTYRTSLNKSGQQE